jgi:hypothetical protein
MQSSAASGQAAPADLSEVGKHGPKKKPAWWNTLRYPPRRLTLYQANRKNRLALYLVFRQLRLVGDQERLLTHPIYHVSDPGRKFNGNVRNAARRRSDLAHLDVELRYRSIVHSRFLFCFDRKKRAGGQARTRFLLKVKVMPKEKIFLDIGKTDPIIVD